MAAPFPRSHHRRTRRDADQGSEHQAARVMLLLFLFSLAYVQDQLGAASTRGLTAELVTGEVKVCQHAEVPQLFRNSACRKCARSTYVQYAQNGTEEWKIGCVLSEIAEQLVDPRALCPWGVRKRPRDKAVRLRETLGVEKDTSSTFRLAFVSEEALASHGFRCSGSR